MRAVTEQKTLSATTDWCWTLPGSSSTQRSLRWMVPAALCKSNTIPCWGHHRVNTTARPQRAQPARQQLRYLPDTGIKHLYGGQKNRQKWEQINLVFPRNFKTGSKSYVGARLEGAGSSQLSCPCGTRALPVRTASLTGPTGWQPPTPRAPGATPPSPGAAAEAAAGT